MLILCPSWFILRSAVSPRRIESSVSNGVIAAYFSQGELWLVGAWEATPALEEGVTNSSQEVSSSVTSCRRGELLLSWEGLQLREAGWPVSRVRCWELLVMDCLEWVGVARHYNENRVPVLGYTLVLLKTMKSVVDMKKYYVLKSNAFVSHSIDSLGIKDFLWIYDLNLGIDLYLSTGRLLSTYCV